jgi:hypothetical protein
MTSKTDIKSDDNRIIIELKNRTTISALSITNRQKVSISIVKEEELLTRSYIYEIPITNKSLNYDNFHAVKLHGSISEELRVLNVRDGLVIIEPILQLVKIKDGMELGILI